MPETQAGERDRQSQEPRPFKSAKAIKARALDRAFRVNPQYLTSLTRRSEPLKRPRFGRISRVFAQNPPQVNRGIAHASQTEPTIKDPPPRNPPPGNPRSTQIFPGNKKFTTPSKDPPRVRKFSNFWLRKNSRGQRVQKNEEYARLDYAGPPGQKFGRVSFTFGSVNAPYRYLASGWALTSSSPRPCRS